MDKLIQRLGRAVKAVLTGLDRIVFEGLIRPLTYEEEGRGFCRRRGILNKHYGDWMTSQTHALMGAVASGARLHHDIRPHVGRCDRERPRGQRALLLPPLVRHLISLPERETAVRKRRWSRGRSVTPKPAGMSSFTTLSTAASRKYSHALPYAGPAQIRS